MLEIRRKGEQMARQTWGDVDPEDLAGTYKVKPLANGVGTLQRTGVLLSQAYVQAFIKSEIGKDVLIPTPQGFSGNSFDDVKLRFALWRPVVLVRQLLEQGVDMPEAMRRGRDTLLRSVSLATDGAVRDSLQKLYDRQPEIVGWKRAVKGTCDICMGAADGSTLPPGTPLDIHPNCECVSEGIVKPPTVPPSEAIPYAGDLPKGGDAFDAYQATAYRDINAYLRDPGGFGNVPELDDLIARMDEVLKKAPATTETTRVYRGLHESIENIWPQLRGQELIGKAVDEFAYSSSTASREVAESFLHGPSALPGEAPDLLEMTVRPGVRGVMLGRHPDAEALFEHDVSYLITGVRVENGQRIIEMDVFR